MDQPAPAREPEKELLKWTALSRPYKPLDRQLFATAIVIIVLISVIAAFAGEWMLIAVLVAMVFAYYTWSTVPPEQTEYVISTRGVKIHGQLYLWEELSAWWLEEKWGHTLLIVGAPLSLPKRLHLVVENVEKDKVKEIMESYLTMDKPLETTVDKISKWLVEKFPLSTR